MGRRWLAAAVLLGGCAQLAGLDETRSGTPIDAADSVDAPPDAPACVGGDARTVDPATGRCYVFFKTPSSRNSARTTCSALRAGSFLASVGGQPENAVIAGIIGMDIALLGGNDEVTEGVFTWDDGTPFVYTNWGAGQPDNGSGVENCFVMLSGGLWNDKPCAPGIGPAGTGSYAFVCEHD